MVVRLHIERAVPSRQKRSQISKELLRLFRFQKLPLHVFLLSLTAHFPKLYPDVYPRETDFYVGLTNTVTNVLTPWFIWCPPHSPWFNSGYRYPSLTLTTPTYAPTAVYNHPLGLFLQKTKSHCFVNKANFKRPSQRSTFWLENHIAILNTAYMNLLSTNPLNCISLLGRKRERLSSEEPKLQLLWFECVPQNMLEA